MSLNLSSPSQQSSGFVQDTLGNNVLFALTNISSQGSGNINAFLRIQGASGSNTEQGYNTNGTIQFDTLKQPSNKGVTRSQLPTVVIDGKVYREFRIDLNESSSNPTITLQKLQIFYAGVSDLWGYDQATSKLAGLSPVVDLNDKVTFNAALNSGSGSGDVLVYIPDSVFGSGNPYVYIYSQFSGSDGGYEEFSYGSSNSLGSFADLSLTKTYTDTSPNTPLLAGDQVDFTLKVTNTAIPGFANTTATGVKVKDLLPAGFKFFSATGVGSYDPTSGIWTVGSVAVGQTQTLTIRANVLGTGTKVTDYTNTAEIYAADQFDPDSTPNNGVSTEDDWASVLAAPIKLSVTDQFTSGNVALSADVGRFVALPDGSVSFQIGVTNSGFDTVSNVVVFDDLTKLLPIGLSVISVTGDGQFYDSDNNAQTVERLFSSILAGQTKTITVNAKVVAGADNSYITPIHLTGVLGSTAVDPMTGATSSDTQLNEYHGAPFDGTFWLSTNFTKAAGETIANFGFLSTVNTARITFINGVSVATGTIQSNEARLDVATFQITGTLSEPDGSNASFTVLSYDPQNGTPYSFSLDADLTLSGAKGTATNHSILLPLGDLGRAIFNIKWYKPTNDPTFSSNLSTWKSLAASADPNAQKSIVNFLSNQFIDQGAGSNLLFESGTFQLTNLTQKTTQTITIEAAQFTPQITNANAVTIVVEATKVTIGSQAFSSLQAALDSLRFSTPTNVIISVQGSGSITASVQNLSGNFNYTNNWVIQEIDIDANLSTVTFASGNGSAIYDLSLIKIKKAASTNIELLGANAADTIKGSSGSETLSGSNGGDLLDGFGGNDIYTGGLGPDTFVLRMNGSVTVQDFSPSNDKFALANGLTFGQLRFDTDSNGGTLIYYVSGGTSLLLAKVIGVSPSAFNSSLFVTV